MRYLIALLWASTAVAGYAVSAAAQDAPAPAAAPAAAAKPTIGDFGFDAAGMDRSVNAGDDFYAYANGTWAKDTAIPADRSNYGMFTMLEELSNERTHKILEEQQKAAGSKSGDFYASFMDRAAVNKAGIAPLQPTLKEIDGADTPAALTAVMGKLSRKGINLPFGTYVDSDDKSPDSPIFQILQGGLGLPDRDYYLSEDPGLVSKREAYRGYMVKLMALAGEKNAEARAKAVLDLETEIARLHWTQVDSRDADKTYNKMTAAELKKAAPAFNWDGYLKEIGVAQQPAFLVRQPTAVTGMAALIAKTPAAVLKDYTKVHTIDEMAPYLSQPFVDANFAFHGTSLNGTPENQADWKRGVTLVTGAMGEEVGKIYVERYFPPESKAAADTLVKNVIAAMDRRIQGLAWMAPETKARARAKLAAFTPKIGYPETWRDYSALTVKRDDLLGNVMRANEFEHARGIGKLGKPIDRTEWFMTPMTINAYANFAWNEIVFPAAILQPPFFDPYADAAINYGGIGAVIGHEISHHFDDQGSKYDETGSLKEWWTPGDVQRFNALTDKLGAQYDGYEVFPGKSVNGKLTMGENIGDLAGVTIAYDAYQATLGGKPAPAIDGFSGDQRFYLGWAQVWRRNYRDDNLLQRLITDPHSPSKQRTYVVRNFDQWYKAYGVQPGQKLYLAPDQRVHIW
ncbi:M13 family metallopeptidase [Allosphingosinicella indica]|uniref:Putative endopeptidase n=1 Tax=Allosphingosinicella indica TaxID=941907 RepID=A0A1X7H2Y3_9SPHN|nr:M13-type metalloendopeptidase [Allosphingosinicella indica]SMF78834.1 putative endopeptidase [Allosphingosinicella indica]